MNITFTIRACRQLKIFGPLLSEKDLSPNLPCAFAGLAVSSADEASAETAKAFSLAALDIAAAASASASLCFFSSSSCFCFSANFSRQLFFSGSGSAFSATLSASRFSRQDLTASESFFATFSVGFSAVS